MENQIQLFKNEQFGEVRTVLQNGEPWFVAIDVCKALEIANSTLFPGWMTMRRIP